ncbi:MAG: hypothetical protein ACK2UL_06590 [Anaerolineae bacterium]
MDEALPGKVVRAVELLTSPHKFAFASGDQADYERWAVGESVGRTTARGANTYTQVGPARSLVLGHGGARILLHETEDTVPRKHQLHLAFDDGTHLTVSIQGWGSVGLMTPEEIAGNEYLSKPGVSPGGDEFTWEHFADLLTQVGPGDKRSVKYFVISEPGVLGVGNGYTQDILFRAGLHPRHRVSDLTAAQGRALYDGVRSVLAEAIELGGRDTEHDLYDASGGYVPVLDRRAVGRPCPSCSTPIEKASYLGGAVYFCPACQT